MGHQCGYDNPRGAHIAVARAFIPYLGQEFQPPLAAMLELANGMEHASDQPRERAAEMVVIRSILVMLGVANDAELEGRSAGVDPANLIDARGTMLQLAFVLASACRLVTASGDLPMSPSVLNAIRCRLSIWLGTLRAETENGTISTVSLRRMVNEAIVSALEEIARPDDANDQSAPKRAELDRAGSSI